MELIELMSPHVAIPVVGVLLCAVMVFAFGFRSPVQPPSFDFEDEEKRIKRKQKSKVKSSTNGHVNQVQNESSVVSSKSKIVQQKAPKEVASSAPAPKAKQSAIQKAEVKKDAKQVLKSEKTAKSTKAALKKAFEDDIGEWTTIPKKGKKVKLTQRNDDQPEAAVESVVIQESVPADAAAAAAPSSQDVEGPKTPLGERTKKKRKTKTDNKEEVPEVVVMDVDAQVSEADGKKKKVKREKKTPSPSAVGAASASAGSETTPQEAAPASVKVTPDEKAVISGKNKQSDDTMKITPAETKEKNETSVMKKDTTKKEVDSQSSTSKKNEKVPSAAEHKEEEGKSTSSKKKKSKAKEIVEDEPKSFDSDLQVKETVTTSTKPSKEAEASVSKEPPKDIPPAEPVKVVSSDKSPEAATPVAPVSFDEMGESWIEAAPKNKKKKSRRDN